MNYASRLHFQLSNVNFNFLYAVIRAIKDCWLDQREYVGKSDHVKIYMFFHSKHCICQNEVVIKTFEICPLKYYFCEGKYVALIKVHVCSFIV